MRCWLLQDAKIHWQVAMYEHLAPLFGGPPNQYHYLLYENWARHDWAMIMTGNVQVSVRHLTLGRDLVVPKVLSEELVKPFKKLAAIMHGESGDSKFERIAIMQLNHSGRQSSNILGGRWPFQPSLAPSALPVRSHNTNLVSNLFDWFMFQTPYAMSLSDINNVVAEFSKGAALAVQSGFDGIELHVAHGCRCYARILSTPGSHA